MLVCTGWVNAAFKFTKHNCFFIMSNYLAGIVFPQFPFK